MSYCCGECAEISKSMQQGAIRDRMYALENGLEDSIKYVQKAKYETSIWKGVAVVIGLGVIITGIGFSIKRWKRKSENN